jgi:hypothetical protein
MSRLLNRNFMGVVVMFKNGFFIGLLFVIQFFAQVGVAEETGSFRYSCTAPDTNEDLGSLRHGFDLEITPDGELTLFIGSPRFFGLGNIIKLQDVKSYLAWVSFFITPGPEIEEFFREPILVDQSLYTGGRMGLDGTKGGTVTVQRDDVSYRFNCNIRSTVPGVAFSF